LGFSFRLERKTDLFKLYVWNLHNSEILLDNLQLTLLSDGN